MFFYELYCKVSEKRLILQLRKYFQIKENSAKNRHSSDTIFAIHVPEIEIFLKKQLKGTLVAIFDM